MSQFIIWDKEAQSLAFGSTLPTREAAEKHIERMVPNLPNVDTGERFAVVEVPS